MAQVEAGLNGNGGRQGKQLPVGNMINLAPSSGFSLLLLLLLLAFLSNRPPRVTFMFYLLILFV